MRRCHSTPWTLALFLAFGAIVVAAADRPTTRLGMHGRLQDIVLPAPELEVQPLEGAQAPLVLRIVHVYPHGTAFRYDFDYYGLEPRIYDLTRYLRPKHGAAPAKLPPLEVQVTGLLQPGLVHPHALQPSPTAWFAGYRPALIGGAVVWVLGLFFLFLAGQRKKQAAVESALQPISLEQRLHPLVVRAMTGILSPGQQAELERTLLAFWRRRLGLQQASAAEALATMRRHPEAGELLHQLELWLHRPGTAQHVDLGKLLRPYQSPSLHEPDEAAGVEGAT